MATDAALQDSLDRWVTDTAVALVHDYRDTLTSVITDTVHRWDGPQAAELAQLRGNYDALQAARRAKGCAPRSELLAADEAAALPIALGERLLYEERREEPATRLRRGLPPCADWQWLPAAA